jgi:hypothetical protein
MTLDQFRPTPQQPRGTELSLGGFLLLALAAVVVGAAVVVTYILTSSKEPSQEPSPEVAEAIAAATAPRETGPTLELDDGTWTDADIRRCSEEAAAAAEAAAKRWFDAVSAHREGLGSPSADMVKNTAYLLCSASHKPTHLCQRYWRERFVEAIKQHAKAFREVSSQAYWTMHSVAERARNDGTLDEAEWQAITDDLRQTTHEVAEMHEEIVTAFRGLIADGIIDPDDFGKFFGLGIPPEIAKMIGGARAQRNRCG